MFRRFQISLRITLKMQLHSSEETIVQIENRAVLRVGEQVACLVWSDLVQGERE